MTANDDPHGQWGRREHEARLDRLIDRKLMHTDPYYNAQVRLFSSWLTQAEMAMEDENVDFGVMRRVLNRMVYGTPTGTEAYERVENQKVLADIANKLAHPSQIVIQR